MTTDPRRPPEPTRDQLLAMAYVDGELTEEARAELTRRLATSPELAREIVAYQRLDLIARSSAPPEPMDHEWARLASEPLQRVATSVGWTLLVVGLVGYAGFLVWAIAFASSVPVWLRVLLASTFGGLGLIFLTVLRRRLRTLHLDPYRDVLR